MNNAKQTPLQIFMARHSLTQRDVSEGSGITLSNVNAIVRGFQSPRSDTVVRLLTYLRQIEPEISFDDLFADPLTEDASEVAEAAGGAHG